jgi:glycolate oxidase FAD binding subunit
MGAVPVAPDVLIVTRRLNRVMQHEPGNLSVEVEAGMTLAELRALLDTHGQILPIDAPFPERTTIGGLVATATTGARRADCGGIRDLLLGITVIEVDGTIIRNGTQMVKNIQGYDLTRLFVHSHGTLGIVACVNLRTFPRPQSDISLLVSCTEQAQAAEVLAALRKTPLRPVAVDYLDNAALHAVDRAAEGCALLVRVVGMHASCERHIQTLHTIVQQHSCPGVTELRSDEHIALWERVEQLAALAELPEDEAVFRLLVPPASLNDALDHLYSCAAEAGLPLLVRAHALNGIIYARVRGVSAETLATLQHHLIERWSHSQILACNPAYKHHLSLWGAPPEGIALMQALKHTFDPEHKLNPGRYIV